MSYEDVVKVTYAYVILSLRFLVTYGSQNSECVSNYSIVNINVVTVIGITFYHDVGEIFWPQPIRSLKLGHVTGQGSMSPTWVGRVSDPGKNSFHKKYKNLDNIAVYLIASLKSKWKNIQIKNMNNWMW